jgi:hypothetical protein
MRWLSIIPFAAVLIVSVRVFAIGPVPIDEVTPDNKILWDNTLVVTAVVKEIVKQEKTWRVISLAPVGVLNGELDPGKRAIIRIGYAESAFQVLPRLREGDRVIAICRLRNPGEDPEYEFAKGCDPGEFALQIGGYIDAGDESICGFSLLSRPGANLDPEKAEIRIQALVEKIRSIRSQK